VIGFGDVVQSAAAGHLKGLYLTAGYSPRAEKWLSQEQAQTLGKVPLLVVQDIVPSQFMAAAKYVLPAVSYAEKDGTFVNHAGLAQAIHWAVPPPGGCRTDGQVFLDLLERRGLLHAETLRGELAAEVPYFGPLACGDLGEHGVHLEQAK
jgi:NADH-quinone oxidoreductase subunit G